MAKRSPLRNALVAIVAVLLTIGVGAVSEVALGHHADYCADHACGD